MDTFNALLVERADNVAVVIEHVKCGEAVCYLDGEQSKSIRAVNDIPIYHKVALSDIAKAERIIKYAEPIGIAACHIPAGSHVHTHNVESFSGAKIKIEIGNLEDG